MEIESWRTEKGIVHGFGRRKEDGEKPVRKDWVARAVEIGGASFPLVSLRQVHGDRVRVFDGQVDSPDRLWLEEGDSVITRSPGFALGVFTADCLPILLHDPSREAIGIVHTGWRGTAKGVAAKAVDKMKTLFHCENLRAALGPCIEPCCFEVDEPVRSAFEKSGLPWDFISRPRGEGKWSLDLALANSLWLERAGIRKENQEGFRSCTCCGGLFYSYRKGDKVRGRQLNFIALQSAG